MPNERQTRILQHLIQHESSEIAELSELLVVSPSTIRRELRVMENNGLILRSHGSARLPTPIQYRDLYEHRANQQIEAKKKIAITAKRLIKSGQVIGLSGGTTSTELARQLRTVSNVTIVTNAINVALELQGFGNHVIVTGGALNQNSYELVGDLQAQSLQNMHLDISFLGVNGINIEFGFSMLDEPEAVASRAFKAASEQTIIIADHTKIGKATFARFCTLNEVDLLITDSGIPDDQRIALRETGLKVQIPTD
jgi:DeoR family transcriptional regulator of aga operon